MATNENEKCDLLIIIILLIEDYTRNISIKVLQNYLQWLGSKCHFSIFPIIISLGKLYAAIATAVKIQTFNPLAQGCHRRNLGPTGPVASEEMSFESGDRRRRRTNAYPISSPRAFGSDEL